MFKWLKRKMTSAAQKQCKFNIRLNTKTLVAVANKADQHLRASGAMLNESDQIKVHNAQKALLKDIILGYSNGLSLQDIKSNVIDQALSEEQVSNGAKIAVDHVINSATESLIVPKPLDTSKSHLAMNTTFLKGNVRIESFNYDKTQFRLIENNAVISVLNAIHLRLVDDQKNIPAMPFFEIIAPMTAVEVLEGDLPKSYLHEYSLEHYVTLRKHYIGE